MTTTVMTTTLRRAGGLAGMVAVAGVLVAAKGGGAVPHHAVALRPVPSVHHARGLVSSGVTTTSRGSVSNTPFGPVQVELVIRNGRVVDVRALLLPSSASYSRQIASYAAPLLRREVLDRQSANIDAVSGATYTSQGYAQSAQAALDKVHLGA